tara:strand:+ start:458 stop:559 length:102 start_codon:yes stop_codon:yes gene_type:complete
MQSMGDPKEEFKQINEDDDKSFTDSDELMQNVD